MSKLLSPEQLEELRKIPTPAISNAIEVFGIRPRNVGFASQCMKDRYPDMEPIAGYATTVMVGANLPTPPAAKTDRLEYFKHILSIPGPRIAVVKDIDCPAVGSFWGEVNSNIHKALGCVGTVTDGGVRDLDEVRELGFHFFSTDVLVSHAALYTIDFGIPVDICGLTVNPGDLLVCDKHGVIQVPLEIAADIPAVFREQDRIEKIVVDYCKEGDVTLEGFAQRFPLMAQESKKLAAKYRK
jgi:4-hydroxy-4-methyl-2-oxoglutarate aldolase